MKHISQPRFEAPPPGGSFRTAVNVCLMTALLSSTVFAVNLRAYAQQATPLRGALQDNVLQAQNNNNSSTAQTGNPPNAPAPPTDSGIPSRRYEPVSPGALPPDDDNGNLGLLGVPLDDGSPPSGPADNSGGMNPDSAALPGGETAPVPAARPLRLRPGERSLLEEERADTFDNGPIEQNREANPPAVRTDRDNLPEPALEKRIIRPDPEPFAPLGIRAGLVTLRPSISTGLRATTNADGSSDGSAALLSETRLRARATTDWARHSAWLDFDGTYDKTISGEEYSAPNIGLRSGIQLDLGERTTVKGEAGYLYRQEDPSAPTTIIGTSNRPAVQELDGSLGVRKEFGKFFADAKGNVDRTTYGNAEFSDGSVVSQKDRNNTFASIALRGGFEMSPAIKPFAEVGIGKLMYDEKEDSNGFQRSGVRTGLRGGVEVDFAEKLVGEFALGYLHQGIDDDRLVPVDGLSVDGAMKWSPQRGTDVDIGLLTRVEGATAPGDSGSIFYEGTVGIKRQARANLDLKATLIASLRDNKDGSGWDKGFGAEIGATYWFNRFFGFDISARHEFTRSEVETRQTNETSIFMGVTLQR
ncbi:outer membrane beta-barrel protein [Phyllobacterium sp. LjRoot231]|uniref:outer membrane beta-barrel protein n=1 Tax=Phyllobacterium sp. LjRoot231 TaxID=3342289 RepID=UPI003ECEE038